METSFFDSGLFSYGILPLLIVIARICDVSLGTLRIIFVSKGKKNIAPIIGFFEVLIWIIAISKIMQNMDNYINYLAYAGGFAAGNFLGILIEEKLAMGVQMIRIFTNERGPDLVANLNCNGFGATHIEGHGAVQKVHIIFTIVQRNDLPKVLKIINKFNPDAFYTIEDVKAVNEGIFPQKKEITLFPLSNVVRHLRKGK